MSMTRAKKDILGMSEEEIRLDLEQQRMEKAAAAEMEQTANIIKKTGIFDRVDSLYGEFGVKPGETSEEAPAGGEEDAGFGDGGSFGGGFGAGDDLGATDDALGATDDALGDTTEPAVEPAEIPMESVEKKGDLIVENEVKKRVLQEKTNKYKNIYTNRLMESLDRKGVISGSIENISKTNDSLADELSRMSDKVDELTKD